MDIWIPKRRSVTYPDKPDFVPDWLYVQAMTAKKHYNEEWEFWVYKVSLDFNCPVPKAEDACIRGIQKEINRCKLVYGDKLGVWFEQYLDMGDIFRKVQHPDYVKQLGYEVK